MERKTWSSVFSHLGRCEQCGDDMPKRTKVSEVATAADNQRKTTKLQQQAQPKDPKQLAREWTLKINWFKDAAEEVKGHLQKLSFRISIKYNAKSLQRIFHLALQN
jgi:hypothetical protein